LNRSLLIISRQPPWAGVQAREALDIALAGGAFDLPITLLFLDDGVLQLLHGQRPEAVQQKNLSANLQALPLFGVEHLYLCRHSLQSRGFTETDLNIPAAALDRSQIQALIQRHDQVITL
jgi:tRNA 2-thiouridine synthesizing protein C